MKHQSTVTLTTLPHESLRALESAVAQRSNWRILTGDSKHKDEGESKFRFVIEKQVRYDLIRGWPMVATYRIMGRFQPDQRGETTLRYTVSGEGGVPLFHAAVLIGAMLAITPLLGMAVFNPTTVNRWIGILLIGVLLASIAGYGWFAYRSYQGHLRELSRFMEDFAQRMVAHQ